MKDVLDTHTHTIVSGHAYNTLKEMALSAADKKLELLGITEHAPSMPGTCHEFYFANLRAVDRTAYGVELILGAELNILDYCGNIDLAEDKLKKLDYAVASMHDLCIDSGTREENTAAIIGAIKNPYVNIIGHPDDGFYPLDYEAIARAAKEHHVLLEINNSSLRPDSHRVNAWENDTTMLNFCKQYGTSIVMNSDAHAETAVGDHKYAKKLLEKIHFPEELVVNTSVQKFKSFLKKP
ncbi:phosphatase [Anaerosinus massiliensis]|uniref:phosphatase n=1 Tax=Massilibacillus massiliensis TaxID=1806837 RepID=UPI000A6627F6|nr:phosphatase [Massilibacillus massiliensis]